MDYKDFKDIVQFVSSASVLSKPTEEEKKQVFASLEVLKDVLPEWAKKDDAADLLHFASNLCYIGRRNANGVCLPMDVARQIRPGFVNRLLDIEHDRKTIVGFITNSVFTKVEDNSIIEDKDLDSYEGDVYLSYAGVVWTVAHPKLTKLMIESSDPSSPKYDAVSSSFELGSNGWDIAVGSEFVKNARIVKEGDKDFEKYVPYLQSKGGNGRLKNGDYVYRNLKLDKTMALGAGFVSAPASQVKGIFVYLNGEETVIESEDKSVKSDINPVSPSEKTQEISENEKIDSNTRVNLNTPPSMKITKVEDIVASLFKEETTASAVTAFISAEIAKASEQYVKQLNEQKDINQKLELAKASAEAKITELQNKISELAGKLNQIEEEKAAAQADADFNERMKAFDDEYDLDEEDRKALVSDIKACKTKEQFETFVAKIKPLMKEKRKAFKKERAAKMVEAIKATKGLNVEKVEVDAKTLDFVEIVASAKEIKQPELPNTLPAGNEPSLIERMKAFKDQIKFNGKVIK